MVWALFALATFVYVIYLVICVITRNIQKRDQPPIVKSIVPILGSLIDWGKDPLSFVTRNKDEYGNVFSANVLGRRLTFITHPSLLKVFYMSPNEVFSPRETYRIMTPIFGKGVVYDATYQRMREQLRFAATELKVENFKIYAPLIQQVCRDYLQHWGDSGKINLVDDLGILIVKTATRCLLGEEVGKLIPAERMARILTELEEGINPLGVFYPSLPSSGARTRDRARAELREILLTIINHRRQHPTDVPDMVGALINSSYSDGEPLSDEHKVGILIGALFAGQHTSSIVSSWTALYLASSENDKVREDLRAERKTLLENNDFNELTADNLKDALLTEACVKESLRLHPPLIFLMREVKKDAKVGDYTVPKGDIVVASPLSSMRSADIFNTPDKWDPYRWLPPREEGKGIEYSFTGFGAGSHRCLGEKFGLLQTKTVISTLFDMFDITIESGEVPKPDYHSLVVGPIRSQAVVSYKRR